MFVNYEFDPDKDAANIGKHGVSLADAERFDWESALILEDTRKPYAERRFRAIGLIGERLYVMIFCMRGAAVRVISLRKANPREVKSHAHQN